MFDVGQQDGIDFLVMEYLDGETLADRLARKAGSKDPALRVEDALRYAIEIADALDKAHRKGIVHRDLKPGNIMLTRSGGPSGPVIAKLLDFGLAKTSGVGRVQLSGPAGSQEQDPAYGATALPTAAPSLTAQGTILGTLQYMAPEQLEGKDADARTDIFAFGALLYEMLTGKKAFEGKTQAGLIAAILEREPPPLRTLNAGLPLDCDWVVVLCLAKDPDDRWQHAGDLLHELRRLRDHGGREATTTTASVSRRPWLWAAAGVMVVAAGVAWVALASMQRSVPPRESLRFSVAPLEGTQVSGGPAAPQAVISPDGTLVAFSALDSTATPHLYVRRLDSLEPRLLAGTDEGELPFWSPDGRFVAFFTPDRKLKKVALSGGPPQIVCDVPGGGTWGGGAWNDDGVIVFSAGTDRPLYRVSSAGGTSTPITMLDLAQQERAHLWPSFLPGGRRFVYLIQVGSGSGGGIHVGSLESSEKTKLLDTSVRASFVPPHHLMFVLDGTLMAQALNDGVTQLTGEPVPVAERVAYNPEIGLGRATFSASTNGVLVYRAGGVGGAPVTELRWFDRTGGRLGTIGQPAQFGSFDLSRDGARVVTDRYDARARQWDILVLDTARGSSDVLLTFNPSDDRFPLWSPDGTRVVFMSDRRGGVDDVYVKPATGAASDELLLESPLDKDAQHWSPDGRFLVYGSADPKTGADVWVLPIVGDRTPRALFHTPFQEAQAQLSPDGRWIAYTSDELGTRQVYVQPIPPSGAKWQVSAEGGWAPRWRGDGRELFYLSADRTLTAVDVKPGATFEVGSPRELFRVNVNGFFREYAVTADGQRFLVNTPVEETGAAITVVVNWMAALLSAPPH